MGRVYKRGEIWWIQYYGHGQLYRESTKSALKSVATSRLRLREGDIGQGRLPALRAESTTFDELAELFLQDYRINGRKSLQRAHELAASLRKMFGRFRACRITSKDVLDYIARRQSEGLASGTINRELAALTRMFRLAARQTPPLVSTMPHIPHLKEHNVRQGFFTDEEYTLLRAALPDHLKVPFILAYWTGMRMGEVLRLRWDQVDLAEGLVRLEPGTTKSGRGRLIPLPAEVCAVLRQWKDQTSRRYPASPWVCHYRGEQLARIQKKLWDKICQRVGLTDKLFHDLRRTAIRNMVRRGISERIAMEISGHRTRSVFDRYDIVSEADIHDARTRMNQRHRVRPGPSLKDPWEWNEGPRSAASLAPSEHNGEHSEKEMKSEEELTS
ncbi:MAG TPA: tyrosine-type recombinase/integrase [Nitrospiraceae bacterium]